MWHQCTRPITWRYARQKRRAKDLESEVQVEGAASEKDAPALPKKIKPQMHTKVRSMLSDGLSFDM